MILSFIYYELIPLIFLIYFLLVIGPLTLSTVHLCISVDCSLHLWPSTVCSTFRGMGGHTTVWVWKKMSLSSLIASQLTGDFFNSQFLSFLAHLTCPLQLGAQQEKPSRPAFELKSLICCHNQSHYWLGLCYNLNNLQVLFILFVQQCSIGSVTS